MNDLLVLLVAGICFLLGVFTGDIIHILFDEWKGSDNMSLKEDAKPHYDEWCDSCQEYDHNKHCCPRWNKVIKNTVEELKAAQPEPHWIPVTERLPEKFDYYLVSGINSVWFARYESGRFLGILSSHALDIVIVSSHGCPCPNLTRG